MPHLTDANSSGDAGCSPYADLLVQYTPPGGTNDPSTGKSALGPPDGKTVTLAVDAVLTVGFTSEGGVVDGSGDDIIVHATAAAGAQASAYVGTRDNELVYAGALTQGALGIDLSNAGVSSAVYVKIVGTANSMDIDALESAASRCGM